MSEETKEDQATRLLAGIQAELRDIRDTQETMARNFNAVVVMVIFGILMFMVNLFLGDVIRDRMASLIGTEEGRAIAEQLEKGERLLTE